MDRQTTDTLAPTAPRLASCLAEVEARIESGDLHGAMRAAESLRVEHPEDPGVLSVLAKAYSLAGDAEKAAEMMAKFLSLSPEYAEAAALLAECREATAHEDHLGSVVVRGGAPGADIETDDDAAAPVAGTTGGIFAREADGTLSFDAVEDGPADDPEGAGAADAAAAAEETGLALHDPMVQRAAPPRDAPSAALRVRVDDLLRQARAAKDEARYDDALGFLSRVLILEDTNEDAQKLEDEIQRLSGAAERELERLVHEGAHLFDQGRLEEARQVFLRAIELAPGHREAVGYLERVDVFLSRQAGAGGSGPGPAASARGKLWVPPDPDAAAPPPRTPAAAQVDAALFDGAEPEVEGGPVEAEAVPEVPREPFSWRRLPEIVGPRFFWLLIAGAIAIALSVAATVALTWWLERAPVETAPLAQQARQPERRPTPDPAPAPAPPVEDPAATAARLAAEGEAAMAARDFAAAVLAFGRVLEIDPKNADVRARLQVAGEEYKRVRTDVDRLQKARDDFAAGEYESALRIFYRLPEGTLPPPVLERYKIAGWYNLGVISLRGADCAKAVTHLTEAMTLAPRDPEVLAAKALADQCRSQAQDRSFYNKADSLPFRDLR